MTNLQHSPEEVWKDIEGFEGYYQISSLGRVKSLDRLVKRKFGNLVPLKGREMKLNIARGYKYIELRKDRYSKKYKIHRLLAIAFIPNPENKPCVNHKNGNKLDNRIENLEWATVKENTLHASVNNLLPKMKGSKNAMSKLTDTQVLEIFNQRFSVSAIEMSSKYGVCAHLIRSILRGDSWNHVTGLPKRKRDENRRILEGKNTYNHYTRKFVDCRKKYV